MESVQTSPKAGETLKSLYKKRDVINNEINALVRKQSTHKTSHPESKIKEDEMKYYHYTPYLDQLGNSQPRVTVAGYVNSDKKELYYGICINDSRNTFVKKTGRLKAMGYAVSTKRKIVRLKSTHHKYVRELLHGIAMATLKVSLISRKKHTKTNGKKNTVGN
jgi:hypothetical protein